MNFEADSQYLGQAVGYGISVEELTTRSAYVKTKKVGEWHNTATGPKMTEIKGLQLLATMPDFQAENKLDKIFVKRQLYQNLKPLHIKKYNTIGYKIDAKTVGKALYYSNLDTTSDPIEYIKLLGLYPSAGIGLALNADGTYKYPSGESDRNTYALYVKRAYERAIFKYVKDAFDALDISQISDEPTLLASYNTMINATLNEVKKWIYKRWVIRVIPGNFDEYTVSSEIPASKQAGPMIDINGKQYTCRDALVKYVDMAKTILDMNVKKVGSRLLQVSDPHAKIEPTAFISDPSRNPFLVYDPSLTKNGQAGFRDVSTSTAQKLKVQYAATEGIAPAKYFEMEPELRQYLTRDIPIVGGGSLSQKELDELTVEGPNYLFPAIAAIAIGAVVATQI